MSLSSVSKSWLLLTGFILFYVIYLLLGALVFSSIERPVEDQLRGELQRLKQEFLNQSCVNETLLEEFLIKALTANKYGVSVLWNHSVHTNWDLASSMFFANTLVTTVGYGHTTPLSTTGKAFSILYALIGVPFTMLVLTACVQRLMHPLVYAPIGLLQNVGLQERKATIVHFVLMVMLAVLLLFVAPALVFSSIEESWSFLDAIYFCFISLFTIGLGDYVPGEEPNQKYKALYKVCILVYLFIGLMVMYLLLRAFHKMADQNGLTTLLHLPHCDESAQEDTAPIIDEEETPGSPDPPAYLVEKAASKPLDPGSQPNYNSISKG